MSTSSRSVRPTRGRRVHSLIGAAMVLVAVPFVPTPATAGQDVVVSPTPDPSHPRVTNGRVYAIDSHGPLVAVGGSFTTVRPGSGGADQTRQWLFMYNSDTGQIVQSFAPELGGPTPDPTNGVVKDQPGVEAIQFAPDGQSLYVGGWFTSVNGTPRDRIVRLNLDGSIRASFQASLNNTVSDMALVDGRLIVGGRFGQANGLPASRLVSVDPATGATQTDFNLPATVSRNQYAPYVNELDASDDGRWLAVSGSFKKIGNAARNQLALIDLQGKPSVANWSTDVYAPNCSSSSTNAGSYIRGLAISPDSSYLVVNTTGAFVGAETMCDTAARWELPPTKTGDNLRWTWRAKTGGDTLWAAEVTDSAVYVGGHQRWMNNPRPSPGGDNDGPGSVQRPGVAALDPLTGVPLSWNPGRDRGRGAEAMHANDDYLFVGHDTDLWGGAVRQRLAGLPVAGGAANPQPVDVELPVNLYYTDGSSLERASFNGASIGSSTTVSGPSVDGSNWSSLRDGFVQNGKLHYFGGDGAFYSRPFTDGSIGAPTNLSTSVGYVDINYNLTPNDQPYGVAETTVATYHQGRIYYVKSGDQKLYQRGYSLQSGIIEGSEYVASSQSFSSARALDFIGDWLYAAWSDGNLYRFYAPDGVVDYSSRALVDDGSSVDWANVGGLWSTHTSGSAVNPTPPSQACAGATPWRASYWPNTSMTGAPNASRCEASVDYNYGNGAPAGTDVAADNFSASWTRQVSLSDAGAIRVTATTDDGVRAYVDGQRVIDSWVDSAATRTGTSKALAPGTHTVRIEYYERSGAARAQVQTEVVAAPPPEPEPDNVPGDTTVTAPAANEVLADPVVSVTGTATDNVGVTQVRVGIYNRNDAVNRWLQSDGSWGPNYAFRSATLTSPGAGSTGWKLTVSLPQGDYAVDARTVDAVGNEDPDRAWQQFSVGTVPNDHTAPTVVVTHPGKNATLTTRQTTFTGSAADDQAVKQVRVGVYNRATSQWLQGDGSWASKYAYRAATLASPDSPSTAWELPVSLPDGLYALDVKPTDRANNVGDSVWRPFVVNAPDGDTIAPNAKVSMPRKGVVPKRPVRVEGTASDNRSVRWVLVAVSKSGAPPARRWLQSGNRWGSREVYRAARLKRPHARSTDWRLALRLPKGKYVVEVLTVDASSNIDRSPTLKRIKVTGRR